MKTNKRNGGRMNKDTVAQDLLNTLDKTALSAKGASHADRLYHEYEAFGALAGLHAVDGVALSQVLQAARERVNALKKNNNKVLEDFAVEIDDTVCTISLIDYLLCGVTSIKNTFENSIQEGDMDADKITIVDEQDRCIREIIKILQDAGLKQHLADDIIADYYNDIGMAVASQTKVYKEDMQDQEQD